jgi:hypothetical protein
MSNVGDALSGGGSSASGVTDSTFADASLGDQMQGGTGDFTGSDISASDAGGGGFQNFSNLATALSGGGAGVGASPAAAQAASMAPTPGAASASGGDPVGAASGTQSGTDPGSTQTGQNQQQQTKPNQNDQQYAPKSATDQLKALLKQLSGKPAGPTGPTVQAAQSAPFAPAGQTMPLPALARGQTGSQSPQMPLPALAAGQTGDQSTGSFQGTSVQPGDGSPVSQVAGAPAANASIPPGAATQPSAAVSPPAAPTQGGGRDITVQPKAGARGQTPPAPQGMPWPQNEPGEVAPGGPALPTRKPTQPPEAEQPATAASPAAAPPTGAGATPRILQDISGASTGSPTALADLAQAARIILPLVGMFMGGGRGRRGGGFHGGRFTHGVGGFRGGGFHPGGRFGHPAWRGAWPYHHPVHGWDMHHQHPGGGWLPLNPAEMGNMGGGQQGGQPGAQDPNAPDPDKPPKETGAEVGPPDQVGASGAIPNVSAKMVDDYTRQAASKWGIDPDTASRVLAQESSYGQAKKPGDNGTSFGPFQLHFAQDGKAMGDQFQHDTGLNPRDPSTWKAQIDYAMKQAAQGGWKPWTTTMNKLGMGQWSGITTRDKFAGQPRTNIEPAWAAAAPTPTLPLTSQPMVAGP